MKKYILLAFVLTLIISCGDNSVTAPSPEISLDDLFFGTDSTLEVVTWNIEHFPKAGSNTLGYLEEIIPQLNVDVIALQEIESTADFAILDAELPNYIGFCAASASYDINLAFLYRTDTVLQPDVYEIYTNEDRPFPRAPLVLEFLWQGNEYVVINNHLKASGDGIINYNDVWDEEYRRLEAVNKLKVYIDNNLPDTRVFVVGDMNDELTDDMESNVFQTVLQQPERYKFADMAIAEGSSSNWSYPAWPSHLDHIMITNELYPSLEAYGSETKTLQIDNYLETGWYEYDNNISDHLPVGIKLVIGSEK
jgi:exonuclease III